MKAALLAICSAALLISLSACGHLDVTADGRRSRVLTGTINAGVALPADTEISVRIVAHATPRPGQPTGAEQPVMRPVGGDNDWIIGEHVQRLAVPAQEPVPFRIEYDADDALLRHGVNLEARVYYNGRVRFRTVNAHVVTLSSSDSPQTVVLQRVER